MVVVRSVCLDDDGNDDEKSLKIRCVSCVCVVSKTIRKVGHRHCYLGV